MPSSRDARATASAPLPSGNGISISFEIFPPKTEQGTEKLWGAVKRLAAWQPQFVSVTCGAGGAAIDGTFALVGKLRQDFDIEVAPHAAFARQSRKRLREILQAYKDMGVRKIVAIRGDPDKTGQAAPPEDVYASTVDYVAELKNDFGFAPYVAAYPDMHPLAASDAQDLEHLKRKLAAGAARAITQFFFLPETFLRFRDRARAAGIDAAFIPGILPIHSLPQAVSFAQGCGTRVPEGFAKRFERWGTDEEALFNEGVAHAVELCDHLRREGVQDFHFYTLNRSKMTGAVCERLGLQPKASASAA